MSKIYLSERLTVIQSEPPRHDNQLRLSLEENSRMGYLSYHAFKYFLAVPRP